MASSWCLHFTQVKHFLWYAPDFATCFSASNTRPPHLKERKGGYITKPLEKVKEMVCTEDKCWHLRPRQEWQQRQPRSDWVWPCVQTCGHSRACSRCLNRGPRCTIGNLGLFCSCHKWSISYGTIHFWLSSFQPRKLFRCIEGIRLSHLQRQFEPYPCKFEACQELSQLCSIPGNMQNFCNIFPIWEKWKLRTLQYTLLSGAIDKDRESSCRPHLLQERHFLW